MNSKRRSAFTFLSLVDSAEREVARILTVITGVVIICTLVQLIISLGSSCSPDRMPPGWVTT